MSKINLNQLEKADTLPFRIGTGKNMKSTHGMWKWQKHYYKPEFNPYKLTERIITNNIGKSFALAFSYYCSKVEQRYQYVFLNEFRSNGYRYRYSPDYYIDNNGLIQTNIETKPKKEIVWYSDDYKILKRHKKTHHPISMFNYVYRKPNSEVIYTALISKQYFNKIRYKAIAEDFETIIVSGYKIIFSSRKDYKYQRIVQEKNKAKRKLARERQLELKQIDYSSLIKKFTTLCLDNIAERKRKHAEWIKLQKDLNEQTIVRLGFDVNTSFRNN